MYTKELLFLHTRSYAADLDWTVGPAYSLGGYILGYSQRLASCLRHSARKDEEVKLMAVIDGICQFYNMAKNGFLLNCFRISFLEKVLIFCHPQNLSSGQRHILVPFDAAVVAKLQN